MRAAGLQTVPQAVQPGARRVCRLTSGAIEDVVGGLEIRLSRIDEASIESLLCRWPRIAAHVRGVDLTSSGLGGCRCCLVQGLRFGQPSISFLRGSNGLVDELLCPLSQLPVRQQLLGCSQESLGAAHVDVGRSQRACGRFLPRVSVSGGGLFVLVLTLGDLLADAVRRVFTVRPTGVV